MMMKRKQLYIDKDNPKEIYPKQYMENVFDSDDETNLYQYLSKFSCINVGYVESAIVAHGLIPKQFRVIGVLCIYYLDIEHIHIDQYVGSVKDIAVDVNFVKDENWHPIAGTDSIIDGTITLDKLSDEVKDLLGANPNVTITNYPDGEDLTQYDICDGKSKYPVNVLKFADKVYKTDIFSGLGRKFLRKNIIDKGDKLNHEYHNVLTQEMINEENTIYIIQYDYELPEGGIKIPANCTLWFIGGTINGGTVTCNNTNIQGVWSKAACGNVTFAGTLVKGCSLT